MFEINYFRDFIKKFIYKHKVQEKIILLSARPLKLVDEFIYLGSKISSTCYFLQILEAGPNKAITARPLTSHLKKFQDEQLFLCTSRKVKMNSWVPFSFGLQDMDTPVLTKLQELTHIIFVQTLDAVLRTW